MTMTELESLRELLAGAEAAHEEAMQSISDSGAIIEELQRKVWQFEKWFVANEAKLEMHGFNLRDLPLGQEIG